jgi:hypothetical protein
MEWMPPPVATELAPVAVELAVFPVIVDLTMPTELEVFRAVYYTQVLLRRSI